MIGEIWMEFFVFILFAILLVLGLIFILKRSLEWIDDEVDDE